MDLNLLEKLFPKLNTSNIRSVRNGRNCIGIQPEFESKNLLIGRSKFGGSPDLPNGFKWPAMKI